MRGPIEAVLFDFDHTLGLDHHLEERVLRDLAGRYCPDAVSDQEIMASLARFRSGDASLADMLADLLEIGSYDGDIVAEYKAETLALLPASLEAMPGALETLVTLRSRGLTVAILSNGWTELQVAKVRGIGFDGPVIVSEEIGEWKPDRRTFEIAGERLGISLARSMYVGDSPFADVAGSKNAGMIAVWADLEGQPYPDGVAMPDLAVTRLDQILLAVAE